MFNLSGRGCQVEEVVIFKSSWGVSSTTLGWIGLVSGWDVWGVGWLTSCPLSLIKMLWGRLPTTGDLVSILLQSMKSLSSDGAGVGGVLSCIPSTVAEVVDIPHFLLLSLVGIDHSSSCLSLWSLPKGVWKCDPLPFPLPFPWKDPLPNLPFTSWSKGLSVQSLLPLPLPLPQ